MIERQHDGLTEAVNARKTSVLLLTGTTGTGKTTMAAAIAETFPPERAIITVDLDQLGWAFIPGAPSEKIAELRADNLAAIWPNLRSAGFEHVVISGAVSTPVQLDRIREAVGDADVIVVRLITPRPLLLERIRARDSGRVLDDHLAIMPVLDDEMDRSRVEDYRVMNDGQTVQDVANEVLQRIGWADDPVTADLDRMGRPDALRAGQAEQPR